jgi:UrcA family protein
VVTNSVRGRRRWISVAGLLWAFGSVSAGFASELEMSPPRQVVRIGDLNLSDSRGVATAYVRLLWAAERVCPFTDSSDHWLKVSSEPCVMQAVSQAVDSIGSAELSAYMQSQPLFRLRPTQALAHR